MAGALTTGLPGQPRRRDLGWRQETLDFGSTHGAAGMEAHGPMLALIGARPGREPPTAPLAPSGGQAMRWGLRGMAPALLPRQQGIISR
jgi:hypothetical protein